MNQMFGQHPSSRAVVVADPVAVAIPAGKLFTPEHRERQIRRKLLKMAHKDARRFLRLQPFRARVKSLRSGELKKKRLYPRRKRPLLEAVQQIGIITDVSAEKRRNFPFSRAEFSQTTLPPPPRRRSHQFPDDQFRNRLVRRLLVDREPFRKFVFGRNAFAGRKRPSAISFVSHWAMAAVFCFPVSTDHLSLLLSRVFGGYYTADFDPFKVNFKKRVSPLTESIFLEYNGRRKKRKMQKKTHSLQNAGRFHVSRIQQCVSGSAGGSAVRIHLRFRFADPS